MRSIEILGCRLDMFDAQAAAEAIFDHITSSLRSSSVGGAISLALLVSSFQPVLFTTSSTLTPRKTVSSSRMPVSGLLRIMHKSVITTISGAASLTAATAAKPAAVGGASGEW